MDDRRFDDLTKAIAGGFSRRRFVGRLAAIAAGILPATGALGPGAQRGGAQVSQAQCGNVRCAKNPGVCADGCVCCLYGNGNSRCRPPGTCDPGREFCPSGQRFCPDLGRCAACCGDGDCADGVCCDGACAQLGTTANCAACGDACIVGPNVVTTACQANICVVTVCAAGYDDCNDDVADGCETLLGTDSDCGACGDACTGTGQTCGGGGTPGACGCTDDGSACGDAVCGPALTNCGNEVACGPLEGNCPAGQACAAGDCLCTPESCPDGLCLDNDCCVPEPVETVCEGVCGIQTDSCGQTVDCTAQCLGCCDDQVVCRSGDEIASCGADGAACVACEGEEICGAGGVCGACVPRTSCTAGECGMTIADGCGGTLTCPPCGVTFTAVGSSTYRVPTGVTRIRIEMFGAEGGRAANSGGSGGRAAATFTVTPGLQLQVNVGGVGSNSGTGGNGGAGGFNGGGDGGDSTCCGTGGGGGGASDVRRGAFGLADRIIVAGGGGTQSAGGTGGLGDSGVRGENGAFGVGGEGEEGVTVNNAGGGGGGWYGGGGGGGANISNGTTLSGGGGGGGGSGYISPASDLQATDTVLQFSNHDGNGVVTITPL